MWPATQIANMVMLLITIAVLSQSGVAGTALNNIKLAPLVPSRP